MLGLTVCTGPVNSLRSTKDRPRPKHVPTYTFMNFCYLVKRNASNDFYHSDKQLSELFYARTSKSGRIP